MEGFRRLLDISVICDTFIAETESMMNANTFQDEYERQWAKLNADDAAAKAKGVLVGRFIQHAHADSHAIYTITREVGNKVEIKVCKIGDGWVLPAWGEKALIARSKAEGFLRQRDMWADMATQEADWWAKQSIGTVVHYSNGFNQYIRGIILVVDGEKKMMPTAMVGDWRPYDLPRRQADGSIYYGYHAEGIVNKTPMRPNASNMYECPDHPRRGDDPSKMEPVSIDVPEMTAAQQKLAALTTKIEMIRNLLSYERSNDPEAHAAEIEAALERAKLALTA